MDESTMDCENYNTVSNNFGITSIDVKEQNTCRNKKKNILDMRRRDKQE